MSLRQLVVVSAVAAGAAALTVALLLQRAAVQRRLPPLPVSVVEFDGDRDGGALRECMIALQDAERRLVPHMPTGDAIVDAATTDLLERGSHVRIAVSGRSTTVVGYIAFGDDTASLIDGSEPIVRVSDLFVVEAARGRGVAQALLATAERHAQDSGARAIRVEALAKNAGAVACYERAGFAARSIEFEKRL